MTIRFRRALARAYWFRNSPHITYIEQPLLNDPSLRPGVSSISLADAVTAVEVFHAIDKSMAFDRLRHAVQDFPYLFDLRVDDCALFFNPITDVPANGPRGIWNRARFFQGRICSDGA
jgi:hypothetical protein